jgi:hypothetical protein
MRSRDARLRRERKLRDIPRQGAAFVAEAAVPEGTGDLLDELGGRLVFSG